MPQTVAAMAKDIKIAAGGKGDSPIVNRNTIELTKSPEYLSKSSDVLARTFTEDPVIMFMMSSLPEPARLAYLPAYMHSLLKAASLNSAIFEEANDFACCAVWMPPGKRVDNPFTLIQAGFIQCLLRLGIGGCKRMLLDFQKQSDACKRKGLVDPVTKKPIARYHYLFFIATDFHARGQGLATKVVARYQEKATKDDLPVWLEATTPHSRDIYGRQGFQIVQEMRLGKGTHAESGRKEKGGNGVPLWAMIWRPGGAREKSNGTLS